MKISCGLLLTDGKQLLVAHVTNKPQWDIPKGVQEEGETPLDCLIREVYEETSIDLKELDESLLDLGIYDYLPTKRLHLFLLEVKELPDTDEMDCSSTFKMYDRNYPEVDNFKYVEFCELEKYMSDKLFPVISPVIKQRYSYV